MPCTPRRHRATATAYARLPTSLPIVLRTHVHHRADPQGTALRPQPDSVGLEASWHRQFLTPTCIPWLSSTSTPAAFTDATQTHAHSSLPEADFVISGYLQTTRLTTFSTCYELQKPASPRPNQHRTGSHPSKSHSPPHPPHQRLPSNGPIKTAPEDTTPDLPTRLWPGQP